MAFVTIEDLYGAVEIIVFPNTLEKYNQLLLQGNVITVFGTLSIEEEKDAKVLANAISGPPKKETALSDNKSQQTEEVKTKNNKRRGLFLRFKSRDDENIVKAKNVTAIFDGQYPLYFYYMDEKKYELQSRNLFVDVNKTMLEEIRRIIGEGNVAFIE